MLPQIQELLILLGTLDRLLNQILPADKVLLLIQEQLLENSEGLYDEALFLSREIVEDDGENIDVVEGLTQEPALTDVKRINNAQRL